MFLYNYLQNLSQDHRAIFVRKIGAHFKVTLIVLACIGSLDVFSGGILTELLGYNPKYGGENFSLVIRYYDTVRANAGVGDALAFGYLMAVGVIFFLTEIRKENVFKIWDLFGLLMCSLSAFLSLTRGAILATILAYLILLLSRKTALVLVIVFTLATTIIFNTGYGDLFLGRLTDSDPGSARSSELRVLMALSSLEFLAKSPWGAGIGTQGSGNLFSSEDMRINTDNYFFHIFLELGLYGGLIFLVYLMTQLSYFFKSQVELRTKIAVFILFVLTSVLSSSIAFATLCVPFWIALFILQSEHPAGTTTRLITNIIKTKNPRHKQKVILNHS